MVHFQKKYVPGFQGPHSKCSSIHRPLLKGCQCIQLHVSTNHLKMHQRNLVHLQNKPIVIFQDTQGPLSKCNSIQRSFLKGCQCIQLHVSTNHLKMPQGNLVHLQNKPIEIFQDTQGPLSKCNSIQRPFLKGCQCIQLHVSTNHIKMPQGNLVHLQNKPIEIFQDTQGPLSKCNSIQRPFLKGCQCIQLHVSTNHLKMPQGNLVHLQNKPIEIFQDTQGPLSKCNSIQRPFLKGCQCIQLHVSTNHLKMPQGNLVHLQNKPIEIFQETQGPLSKCNSIQRPFLKGCQCIQLHVSTNHLKMPQGNLVHLQNKPIEIFQDTQGPLSKCNSIQRPFLKGCQCIQLHVSTNHLKMYQGNLVHLQNKPIEIFQDSQVHFQNVTAFRGHF